MAVAGNRLQNMLQTAVQSVQWTYSLFWQICPQQGMLIWGDGYYNGAIKTRKTIQPMEVTSEEASLQRSQQLRELYDSLSAGDTNNQAERRPCAALSPEDLTETEWFYLMCVSFSFPPGCGLPGKAYAKRQHVWLTGANESDSKTFSRAILAKSARVQTVVCIPILDGVVEFGTTERVQEDIGFVQHVKTFFTDVHHPPKPALSGHSTSNPAGAHNRFHQPVMYVAGDPPVNAGQYNNNNKEEDEDEDEDEDKEEEAELDSKAETGRSGQLVAAAGEPSELIMQLEMSEDIRLGSPDDASNNLDAEFHMMGLRQQRQAESFRAESMRRWSMAQPPSGGGQSQPLVSGSSQLDELSQEDTHYSQTVSTILHNKPNMWAQAPSAAFSAQSAFAKWTILSDHHLHLPASSEGTSQWLLKYILFTLPLLYDKNRDEMNSSRLLQDGVNAKIRKSASQDELSANHVLAERRRREKLNERFIVLRSLVPYVTKMDKASILGDTIEYLKHLRKKIQDLETCNRQMETIQRSRSAEPRSISADPGQTRSGQPGFEKRKLRVVEGSGGKAKTVEAPEVGPAPTVETSVEVSIIESDALVEIHCPYRDGLLLDIMGMLRELRVEITTVQSSMSNGAFQAELRAKVKENNGKKTSIVEVKRAIHQIIPQTIAE